MDRCKIVCTLDGKELAVIFYDKYADLENRTFPNERHARPLHNYLSRQAKGCAGMQSHLSTRSCQSMSNRSPVPLNSEPLGFAEALPTQLSHLMGFDRLPDPP
jgi:hypothetical protein